jgi:hypothetical protein
LVINGPHRGRVANVNTIRGCFFVDNPNFLSWYERWLDELLCGYDVSWFGVGLTGTEQDMIAVLCNHESTIDKRLNALVTLQRCPSVGPETVSLLIEMLRAGPPVIRVKVMRILGKQRDATLAQVIRPWASCSSPDVRMATLHALKDMNAADWMTCCRAALDDSNSHVSSQARYLLEKPKRRKQWWEFWR